MLFSLFHPAPPPVLRHVTVQTSVRQGEEGMLVEPWKKFSFYFTRLAKPVINNFPCGKVAALVTGKHGHFPFNQPAGVRLALFLRLNLFLGRGK